MKTIPMTCRGALLKEKAAGNCKEKKGQVQREALENILHALSQKSHNLSGNKEEKRSPSPCCFAIILFTAVEDS